VGLLLIRSGAHGHHAEDDTAERALAVTPAGGIATAAD
jgi:hypothetical protein